MEDVKFIELVFENVESIVVPMERVKRIDFGKLETFKDYPFEGYDAYKCEYLILDIIYQNESDLQYDPFKYDEPLGMFHGNPMSNNVQDRPNILGRIMNHNDLVMVELLDANQKHIKNIYIPWHEEDEYNSRYITKKVNNGILNIEAKI